MKTLLTVTACTLLLAACGKPAPTESVESLMANPDATVPGQGAWHSINDVFLNNGNFGRDLYLPA